MIFTKNASEAINLVANTLAWAEGPLAVGPGDEVLVTEMEHHSNIVPWQLLTERKGATLRWFGITDDGRLDTSNIDELIPNQRSVAPLRSVSSCHGTRLEWCSISVTTHLVAAPDPSGPSAQAKVLRHQVERLGGVLGEDHLLARRRVQERAPPCPGPLEPAVDSAPSWCMARETLALCRSRWSTIVSITTCGFCEVFALSR